VWTFLSKNCIPISLKFESLCNKKKQNLCIKDSDGQFPKYFSRWARFRCLFTANTSHFWVLNDQGSYVSKWSTHFDSCYLMRAPVIQYFKMWGVSEKQKTASYSAWKTHLEWTIRFHNTNIWGFFLLHCDILEKSRWKVTFWSFFHIFTANDGFKTKSKNLIATYYGHILSSPYQAKKHREHQVSKKVHKNMRSLFIRFFRVYSNFSEFGMQFLERKVHT